MKVALTILGEPASKANSRQIVNFGKRAAVIKSKKARSYEENAAMQIPASARAMFAGPVRVRITIFYASMRPDLDESVVLDVLQAKYTKRDEFGHRVLTRAGVYVNDRQVWEKDVRRRIDPHNPRAEIEVEEIVEAPKLFDLPPPEPLARMHVAPKPEPMPERPF